MTTRTKLTADEARRLAVLADVDPRSLFAVLEGRPVRGMAGRRARLVLEENGYLAPTNTQADTTPATTPKGVRR